MQRISLVAELKEMSTLWLFPQKHLVYHSALMIQALKLNNTFGEEIFNVTEVQV